MNKISSQNNQKQKWDWDCSSGAKEAGQACQLDKDFDIDQNKWKHSKLHV